MLTAMLLLTLLSACTSTEPETPPLPAAAEPKAPEVAPPRNVLVLLIDTLRADALAEAETPNIDALNAGIE